MTTQNQKNPLWFSIVAVIAVIWNLIGVLQYLGDVSMSDEAKALLDPELVALMGSTPKFITALYAIAVWGGFVASVLLLLKKAKALLLFQISLIAVILNTAYYIFFTNGPEVVGEVAYYGLQSTVILIAVLLVYLSKKALSKNWIS
jgi:hypothetical protein